jgi:hypothetical protein
VHIGRTSWKVGSHALLGATSSSKARTFGDIGCRWDRIWRTGSDKVLGDALLLSPIFQKRRPCCLYSAKPSAADGGSTTEEALKRHVAVMLIGVREECAIRVKVAKLSRLHRVNLAISGVLIFVENFVPT